VAKDYTLDEYRRHLDQLQELELQDLLGRLPGAPAILSEDEDLETALNRTRQIIDAMTDEERRDPELIDQDRRSRIAVRSRCQPQDVENLLAHFRQMRTMMRRMIRMSVWQRLQMLCFGKFPEQDERA
jgi:signal recognition particle subunit SRP54